MHVQEHLKLIVSRKRERVNNVRLIKFNITQSYIVVTYPADL